MRTILPASVLATVVTVAACGGSPAAPAPAAAAASSVSDATAASAADSPIAAAAGAVRAGSGGAAACVSSLFLRETAFGGLGGTTTATVFAPTSCQWHPYSDQSFMTVGSAMRSGDGTFTVTVSPATGAAPREARLSVNNRSVLVTQLPKPPAPPAPPPGVATYFALVGEPGDYIAGGVSRVDVRNNAAFEASVDSSRTTVSIRIRPADGTSWNISIGAPAGAQLAPGIYENVQRWPFYQPGLAFSGNGAGCNQLTGRFVIHEAVFSGSSTVERFRMSFEQHCEFRSPAAFGEIALVAPFGATPHTPPPPGHPPSPTPASTTFALTSDPGDYIGQGQSATYGLENAAFTVEASTGSRITLRVTPAGSGSSWSIDLVAPEGLGLLPGIYDGATRYPFQSPVAPGLSFSGMGRGCNTLTGRFVVYEAQYGPGFTIDRFRATFEQHCEGGDPAARGDLTIIGTPPR